MEQYKLYCDDCINILHKLSDRSIDLIVTDPPYGIEYSTFRTHSQRLINDTNDLEWFADACKEFSRVLKKGAHIYCFTDIENSPDFIFALRKNNFKIRNLLAIPRGIKGVGGSRIFQQQFEYCIFATLGKKGKVEILNKLRF